MINLPSGSRRNEEQQQVYGHTNHAKNPKAESALAGWTHYLAFDLFIGAWEVRTARAERIPFLAVVPCLALTFLFGPAGYLAFSALRAARAATLSAQAA